MCSILFSTFDISEDLEDINFKMQKRGPDFTKYMNHHKYYYLHNLLSITGQFVVQPIISSCERYVCLFNGEIYNFTGISECEYIINLYKKDNLKGLQSLDGEFAITLYDSYLDKIILVSDIFRTKPLYFAFSQKTNHFIACSYRSTIEQINHRLDLDLVPQKIVPNSIYEISLEKRQITHQESLYSFDLRQYRRDFDHWCGAFENAIRKRAKNVREKIFLGLSSGHDSGSIACALTNLGLSFKTYTIRSEEALDIVQARFKFNRTSCQELIYLSQQEYLSIRNELYHICENDEYEHTNMKVIDDPASIGLAKICRKAKAEDYKIYLSGQGADEILCDYSIDGNPIFNHASFNGIFPQNLSDIFPWHSFYSGTQASYISKEECVAGAYGIEARYPFLDRNLVQEFLWLAHDLKNSEYKAPIDYYLKQYNYPFQPRVKMGFSANRNLI